MSNHFHHEDEVRVAYEAAELVLAAHLRGTPLCTNEKVQRIARAVADAVIRSGAYVDEDISTVPGVTVEQVFNVK